MNIAGRDIGPRSPIYIIAEAGVNHNGSIDRAFKLIDIASNAGADAVKFQSFSTEEIIISGVKKAPYQKLTTKAGDCQVEMLKELEIDEPFHIRLIEYCKEKGITFLSTPYDVKSLDMLVALGVPAIKVASTDTTNLLFLEKVAQTGLPVILATGMCTMDEVDRAVATLRDNGCVELAILKCTSNYPAAIEELNLKGMATLGDRFDTVVGFSDHSEGIGASPYAVACGAKIIEKHFTIDKEMDGPDHRASLSPEELKELINEVREVELMLGSGVIEPSESEAATKRALQKCFVARTLIKEGEKFTRENIIAKRTGGEGISAVSLYEVLGKSSTREITPDEVIRPEDLLGDKP